MRKCIICGREICPNKTDVCETCYNFLKWKHGNKYEEKIAHFRKLREKEQRKHKLRNERRRGK